MKRLIMLLCFFILVFSSCSLTDVREIPNKDNGAERESLTLKNEPTSGSDNSRPPTDEIGPAETDDKEKEQDHSSESMDDNRETPHSDMPLSNGDNNPDDSGKGGQQADSGSPDEPDSTRVSPNEASAVQNGSEQSSGKATGEMDDIISASGSDSSPNSILNGKIICIDPGHGNPKIPGEYEKIAPNSETTKPGTAYGTQGVSTNIPEYVLNMEVSLKLRTALEAQGCIVVMTRESNDENLGNILRAQIGNEAGSDLVIRIHADGSTNKDAHGVSVLYPGDRHISDDEILTQSKSASQYAHDAIVQSTGAKPRGIVKRDDLTGFNWTTRPTILIEMGFMTNPEEDRLLNDPAYQDQMVEGILNGLLDYFSAYVD